MPGHLVEFLLVKPVLAPSASCDHSLYLYIFLFQQVQIRNLQADSHSHSEASIKSQFHDYVIVQLNTHKCTCVFDYPEGKLSSSAGLTPQK